MGRINVGGVVKGGLLAGLVINILEAVIYGVILAKPWGTVMQELGMRQGPAAMVEYVLAGFVVGLLSVWLYAAMRPRFGPGPGTALKAGLAVWALGILWPTAGYLPTGPFPAHLLLMGLAWELVELPVATLAGAWVYTEPEAAPVTPAA